MPKKLKGKLIMIHHLPSPHLHQHPPVPAVHSQAPVPHQIKQEHKPVLQAPPPNVSPFFKAISQDDQNKQKSWLI
jgi:hypothetical protein